MNSVTLIKRLLNLFDAGQDYERQTSTADTCRVRRELSADALEPRILYSAAPVEAPANEAPAQEAPAAPTAPAQAPTPDAISAAETDAGLPADGPSEINSNQQVTLVDLDADPVSSHEASLNAVIEGAAAEGALDEASAQSLWSEGIRRWVEAGIDADQLAALQSASLEIFNLKGSILGAASGNSVVIDDDGAGQGWFVDATPEDDSDLPTDRIDLLSVLMHEQGHLLGLDHDDETAHDNVMLNTFQVGERRTIAEGQADGAVAGSLDGVHSAFLRTAWTNAAGDNEFTNAGNWTGLEAPGLPGNTPPGVGNATNAIIQGGGFSGANAVNLTSDFTPANFFTPLLVRAGSHLNISANLNIPGTGFLAGQTGIDNIITQTAGTVTSGGLEIGNAAEANATSIYNLTGGTIDASSITIDASGRLTVGATGYSNSPITINNGSGGSITATGNGGELAGLISLNQNVDFRGSGLTFSGGINSVANQGLSLNGRSIINANPIDLNTGTLTITSNGLTSANATQLNVGGNDWALMRINFNGYLLLGGENFLPADSDIQFGWHQQDSSGGTLDLNGFDQTVASISVTPFFADKAGNQNITGGGTLTINQSIDTEYQGRITDGATATHLVKDGVGTLTLNNLSGTPSSYTGDTTVNAGTLSIANVDSLADTSDVHLATGAVLDLNFSGTDTINQLFIDGVNQALGTWGAIGSGADHETALITGSGILNLVPVNDEVSTNEDTALNVSPGNDTLTVQFGATSLLANDPAGTVTGIQGTNSLVGTSDKGAAVSVNPDGTFTYDPSGVAVFEALAEGESTTDTFTYTITNGSNSSTVTTIIDINGVNDAPELSSVSVTVSQEGGTATLSGSLADPDTDDFILTVDWGDGGDLEVIDPAALPAHATFNFAAGTGNFTVDHTYLDEGTGSFNVDVQVFERLAFELQGLWNFNDGTAADGTANGNDGAPAVGSTITYSSDTPTQLGGGQSASSDQSGYLTVASSASLEEIDDQLTVAFWIRAEAADNSNWVRMIRKGTEASGQTTWMVNRDFATSEVGIRTDTSGVGGAFNQNRHRGTGDNVLDGEWHHVAYVLDGTSTKEYIDGALLSTQSFPLGNGLSNTQDLRIFGRGNGTQSLDGAMDDVAVWSRPLSDTEIAAIAAGSVPTNGASAVVSTTAAVTNVAPVVNDLDFMTDEDTAVPSFNVLTGLTDQGILDTHTADAVTNAATTNGGRITILSDGTATYTLNPAFQELDENDSTTDTYVFTVRDNDGAAVNKTITIDIDGLNDAPVLAAGVGNFADVSINDINNDGDLVSALINGQISDVDDGSVEGIAITGTMIGAGGSGKFQFSIDDGDNWSDIGAVSDSSALVLRPTDRVRFVPDTMTFIGGNISFRAWDQTALTAASVGTRIDASTNGGTSPFSADTRISTVVVANLVKDGDDIIFTAGDTGEMNDVKVTYDAATNELVFSDSNGNVFTSTAGPGGGTNEVRVVVDNNDNLFIDTGDDDDKIRISNLGPDFMGNLTVFGGAGQDSIQFDADADLAAGNDALFTAERISTNGADLSTSGDGTITMTATGGGPDLFQGVHLLNSTFSSDTGAIAITGEGGTAGGYNDGARIQNTDITTTDADITITGTGGGNNSSNGVYLLGGSSVSAGLSGNLSVIGVGSATSASSNNGVRLDSGSALSVVNGLLTVAGTGGGTGAGNLNKGIYAVGSSLTATGNGSIDLDGTGSTAATGSNNLGIELTSGTTVDAQGSGSIAIDGTGGGSSYGRGILLNANSDISAAGGTITLDGTGSTSGSSVYNQGIALLGAGTSISNTGAGTITLVGTGGSGSSNNQGIQLKTGPMLSTVNGNLTLTGVADGSASYNTGVDASGVTLQATGSGNINVNGTGSQTSSGLYNRGVNLANSTSSAASGNLTITGNGGTGSLLNIGVHIYAGSHSSASGTTSVTGNANAGTTSALNRGVYLQSSSVTGAILNVIGTGGGGSSHNQGVYIYGGTTNATGGANTITGTALGATTGVYNSGVYILNASVGATTTVDIDGTGGGGTGHNHGIYMNGIIELAGVFDTTGFAGAGIPSEDTVGNFF